jgi:hypothetical protein
MQNSLTLIEQASHKKQQLNEALDLLDRLGADIDWALDFCDYQTIKDVLSPISYNISEAHDELESQLDRFEEAIEEYNLEKHIALNNLDKTSVLFCLLKEV